jgi:hypothetical protein
MVELGFNKYKIEQNVDPHLKYNHFYILYIYNWGFCIKKPVNTNVLFYLFIRFIFKLYFH